MNKAMFNLENAIKSWKRKLRSNPAFEDGDVAELESHLIEEIERLKSEGMSEEEAFKLAADEIGEPEPIGDDLYKSRSKSRAGSIPPWREKSWVPTMFPNYMKVAIRNLKRDPVNSGINVIGLAMGLVCVILISLFVIHEMSYDRFHEKSDRIYRLAYDEHYQGNIFNWAYSWSDWADGVKAQFPEIEQVIRIAGNPSSFNDTVEKENETFREAGLLYADAEFFQIFDYKFLMGDPETALLNPNSVVLSEEAATKYFGTSNPIGQELLLNSEEILEVTGVVETANLNSHINFNILLSFNLLYSENPDYSSEWIYTYILLTESADVLNLEDRLIERESWFTPHPDFGDVTPVLQSITDIHLHSKRRGELGTNGDVLYVYTFSMIAILILVITCLNYINLSSAGSFKRFREIGMRKTLGAKKKQLVQQFLGESILIVFIAMIAAILLAEPLSKLFNSYLNTDINTGYLFSLEFLLIAAGLTILTGLLAGLYPSIYLSSLNPISTLKTGGNSVHKKRWFRDGGVVLQFMISTVLLISAFVITKQVNHMKNTDTGFTREQIITIPISGTLVAENLDLFKNNLLENSSILVVTASSTKPAVQDIWVGTFQPEGFPDNQRNWIAPHLLVEHDFLETYDIEIIEGRGFSKDYPSDIDEAFILNETAVRNLGWEDPIGKSIQTWGDKNGQVIGVVRDFHFENLRQPIQPLVLHISERHYGHASIKINTASLSETLEFIEEEWNNTVSNLPFQYTFLDNEFEQIYQAEVRMGRLTFLFTSLALFFASLGLLGLTAFTIKSKTKEIGIRKVLGATVPGIMFMVSKDFTKLVCIAIVFAIPVSWYLLEAWLSEYAIRIELEWEVFAVSSFITVLIASLTVTGQSIKSALMNPVKSLRSE